MWQFLKWHRRLRRRIRQRRISEGPRMLSCTMGLLFQQGEMWQFFAPMYEGWQNIFRHLPKPLPLRLPRIPDCVAHTMN